jgi:hypothetical protein
MSGDTVKDERKNLIMTLTAEESLDRIEATTDLFSRLATATDCYAYTEFAGLLREYCKICRENLARGIDFRELNGPCSQRMELQSYHIDYFKEKLNFIFQGLLRVEGVDSNSKNFIEDILEGITDG